MLTSSCPSLEPSVLVSGPLHLLFLPPGGQTGLPWLTLRFGCLSNPQLFSRVLLISHLTFPCSLENHSVPITNSEILRYTEKLKEFYKHPVTKHPDSTVNIFLSCFTSYKSFHPSYLFFMHFKLSFRQRYTSPMYVSVGIIIINPSSRYVHFCFCSAVKLAHNETIRGTDVNVLADKL